MICTLIDLTAIIKRVESWCREMNLAFIAYNTAEDNKRLIELLENFGFEIIQRDCEMVKLKKTLS